MKRVSVSASVYVGETLVGHLTHYQDGRNVFVLDEAYSSDRVGKPTLSLSFNAPKPVYTSMHALPVFFSNLLPEGYLREYMIETLSLRANDEFAMLMALREDLPGNIRIVPDDSYMHTDPTRAIEEVLLDQTTSARAANLHFSLAGVQIKFSMHAQDHQFTLKKKGLGDTIVKTPSVLHAHLPENEYSMMKLAEAAGVTIPDIQLVEVNKLSGLPELNLPNEKYAYAIKRFDRQKGRRIHIEDFAQAFDVRSSAKYTATNYDSMANLLNATTLHPEDNVAELIRRITVDVLIANTDSHLKNFSLIYPDGIHPELSPAYDLITSLGYISNTELALNFAKRKNFYELDAERIAAFAKRIDLPLSFVEGVVGETVRLAENHWPALLETLPVPAAQKKLLQAHWKALKKPFQLEGI